MRECLEMPVQQRAESQLAESTVLNPTAGCTDTLAAAVWTNQVFRQDSGHRLRWLAS
ncbi:hypothetical protein CCHR01_08876 [Colletotrichum chrysophilum]|uniref:Uncharacterized protein n=1 Tax=Colletotrichum chrysophilum TaxID=1836956 RepID=A0AAD9AKG3_9PEZI|nr:hypothetical protein CCHR01_08876 [Colletotrichum chrysophilum]